MLNSLRRKTGLAEPSRPAALLVASALAVLSGDLCGEAFWGGSIPIALGFFALAIALSLAALRSLSRTGKPTPAAAPAVAATPAAPRRLPLLLAALLLLHLVVAVVCCRLVPANDIDCFVFQQTAARRLLHGVDPFGGTEPDLYSPAQTARFYAPADVRGGHVEVGLQYPPLTVLWVLPGYLLGDVRYSYLLAVLLSAALLYAVAPNRWGFGLAAFLLLNPYTFFVENRCWTEPLPLLCLCATVYTALRRSAWLPVAFGLLLAAKQYDVLALPLAGLLLQPFRWRRCGHLLALSLLVAALVFLPFAVWNRGALWHDLVLFHLAQPFRADALSFAVPLPFLVKIGPLLVALFLCAAAARLHGPAAFAAAFALAVLLFFTTGKQAFTNYFFLVSSSLLLGAASLFAPPQTHRPAAAGEQTTQEIGESPLTC